MKVPVAAAKQAPAPGFGVLTLHAIKGRLQVLRPDGVVLDLEHTARRGVAGGYASLDASALVPFAQLGTGTATGSKFLRDDRTWQVPAGGGGGAPTDAQYLTLTTNATLTQERTISLTLPLSGSDGGAGAAYTFSLSGWSGTTDGRLLYRNGTALATATMTAPVVFSGGALSVSVFTGDSGSGGTTGLVPAPSAGDGMAGKYLAADGTWTQLPTGLATFYLDPADSSDIATYKTALVAPATTAETTLTVGATGTGDNLLAAFATEPTVPGVTLLPHGVVSFHLHVATGAANQIGRVKVEIYTCNASGGSETLQASGYSDSFFDASQDINVDINIATGAAMATTDRLVFKVSAARVSGPATCNITVYFNGATRIAFAKTTIGALTPQLVGAQPWDADLTALAALGDGLPYRNSGTWGTANPAGMLSVVSGAWKVVGLRESGGQDLGMGAVADGEVLRRSGTSIVGAAIGVVFQAYNALLAAIAGLGTNGLIVRTSSSTAAARSIEVGAGLSISNGDGVSGNPSITLEDMIKSVRAFNYFSIVLPQGPTTPNLDGIGVLSTTGISNTAVAEANFPAFQIGDVSTVLCRWYILAYYRIEAGTYVIYFWFRLKADITTGTQTMFMGLSSAVGLSSADPAGHRACIRYVSGTDTKWQLSTKDGTTQTLTDTTIAVTASYYYAVKMTITSSSAAVVIGRAATAAGAITDLASAGSTSTSSNMPATGTDLYLIQSINRSGATTTARGIVSGGAWLSLTP